MILKDNTLVPEGLTRSDPRGLKTVDQMADFIEEIGFLPLFKCGIEGFSAEEYTIASDWWTGSKNDPWNWREVIAGQKKIAYGKFFGGRAGFITKRWFPYFAAYRRDGYDFDSLYEDGKASRRTKLIMDVLESESPLPSIQIKRRANFGKDGEKGFEGAITLLQMQTYVSIQGFRCKMNKKGEEYGMPCSLYAPADKLFSYEHISSKYSLSAKEAYSEIYDYVKKKFPGASENQIKKEIK